MLVRPPPSGAVRPTDRPVSRDEVAFIQNVVVKVRVRVLQENNDNVQHGEVESEFVSRNPYELTDFSFCHEKFTLRPGFHLAQTQI